MDRLPTTLRRAAALAALALFALGSNFCLLTIALSQLSGRSVSCHGAVAAMASHCAPSKHAPARAPQPPSRQTAPCCVALTPVASPEIAKAMPAPTGVVVASRATSLPRPTANWVGGAFADDPDPPPILASAGLGSRAPPSV